MRERRSIDITKPIEIMRQGRKNKTALNIYSKLSELSSKKSREKLKKGD